MTANETNDTYFNYKDYSEIKEKFLRNLKRDNSYDSEFLKQALNELKVEPKHQISFGNIFIELQKQLNQDGILVFWDGTRGCKYINYVLNDGIIKSNSDMPNETAFEMFKQFEDKMRKKKGSTTHICNLYYTGYDIYNKMNTLYNLYDKFTALYPINNSNPDCTNLFAFVYVLNDYVNSIKHNETVIFKKKLSEFINYIKNHKWSTEQKCNNKLSHITSLNPDPPVETEVSRSSIPDPPLQRTSTSSDSQSVTVDESQLHTNGGSLLSTDTQDHSVRHHTTEEIRTKEALQFTDSIPPRTEKGALEGKAQPQEEYSWNALSFKGKSYPDGSIYHGALGPQNIENETSVDKGYLRKVTDAVSGFMEGNYFDTNIKYYISHTDFKDFNYIYKFKLIQHIILFFFDSDKDFLNTKYYYGKLNTGWDGCQFYGFYEEAKNILDKNKVLENDSDKILRALCYIYKNRLSGSLDSDKCNFLYFWLGNILLEKLENNIFFHDIISKLFETLTNVNNHKICELPHLFMLKEDFKDIKTIFDCSEDYKSYKEKHIYPRMSCNNNYKSYLDTNINIYNKFYGECEVEKNKYEYCKAFRKYFPDNKRNLLSEFYCFLKSDEPEPENSGGGHDTELVQLQGEKNNRESAREQKLTVAQKNGFESHALTHESSVNEPEAGDLQILASSYHSDGTSPSITSKSITGAVSVAGALVPSYLLYNVISTMINKYNALLHYIS
ncbi:hypothetical protein PVIIG_05823 [Plasmodium vivax India VII]|uniref:Uncharacterized protein n=1 Tax=Plasmodium vivax India VII TaxID=1077284 RepID=A0A0J9S2E1_PLAVI|nr:hypothetical protein PVIIG_05823 [Plasmodium vivax India VII]